MITIVRWTTWKIKVYEYTLSWREKFIKGVHKSGDQAGEEMQSDTCSFDF